MAGGLLIGIFAYFHCYSHQLFLLCSLGGRHVGYCTYSCAEIIHDTDVSQITIECHA